MHRLALHAACAMPCMCLLSYCSLPRPARPRPGKLLGQCQGANGSRLEYNLRLMFKEVRLGGGGGHERVGVRVGGLVGG